MSDRMLLRLFADLDLTQKYHINNNLSTLASLYWPAAPRTAAIYGLTQRQSQAPFLDASKRECPARFRKENQQLSPSPGSRSRHRPSISSAGTASFNRRASVGRISTVSTLRGCS